MIENCFSSRDLGVGNETSNQLGSENDRMLENRPVADHNSDIDKVKNKV